MAFVELRVELPAYAHTFLIQVPQTSTVHEVKQEIFRTCIGGPRVEGQRIIWRGRYLVDHEKVGDLWKSVDEPRIIHLAVHPSAWSSSPPEIPVVQQHEQQHAASPPPRPVHTLQPQPYPQTSSMGPSTRPPPNPLLYILMKHQDALQVLTQSGPVITPAGPEMVAARMWAMQIVARNNYVWPAILDEVFPPASVGGLKYEQVILEGQSYLTLTNPLEKPTPIQIHALRVLSATFPLLSLNTRTTTTTYPIIPSQTIPLPANPQIPANVNEILRQLGLPQLRAPNQPIQNGLLPELRELPIRPLLAPMMMLIFRTMLLLYFVAPARKPIFGILIIAWMLYEIWMPIRNGLIRGWRRAIAEEQRRQNPNAAAPAGQPEQPNAEQIPNAQPGPRPPNLRPGGIAAAGIDQQAAALFNTLGNMNVQAEEQILNHTGPVAPPTFSHKLMTFVSLLFTTLHPAVWNRRRVALRQREGRIRTEAVVRTESPPTEGEEGESDTRTRDNRARLRMELTAQHARRPVWIQRYIERVVEGDWVDDSD